MFRRFPGDEASSFRLGQFTACFWRACGFALLLLFAQHLAQTHALEHRPLDSLSATVGEDVSDCPQCLALGGLHGGAVATLGGEALHAPNGGPLAFLHAAEPPRRPTTAHTIRAPPKNRD